MNPFLRPLFKPIINKAARAAYKMQGTAEEAASKAFEKAIQLEPNDCTIYLNYAIVIYNRGYSKLAYKLF